MGAQQVLSRLPEKLRQNGLVRLASTPEARVRPGILAGHHEAILPVGERPAALRPKLQSLVTTGLIELPLDRGDSVGTELGLRLASELQREPSHPWVAFVDPLATLHAPGVSARGVLLERLLVVRPQQGAVRRVLVRLVESEIFGLVIVDLAGTPTESIEEHLGSWVRVTRRLHVALRGQSQRVLLLTSRTAQRPLPLAVSQRLDAARVSAFLD